MKSAVNAHITIGYATIPVGVAATVTSTKDPSFKVLHEKCKTPVSVRRASTSVKKASGNGARPEITFCSHCEVDVEADQTVRGYEYAKGMFVYFTEQEMGAIKPERQPLIELGKFVKVAGIKTEMVSDTYFLVPNPNLGDPYGLLYQALAETKMAGIGSHALWGKEHPCAVVAADGRLLLWTLHIFEDIVVPDFETPIPKMATAKKMMKQLLTETHAGEFDPVVDLASPARMRVKAAVEAKIAQRPIEVPGEAEPVSVPDITEALRREVARKAKKVTRKPRAKGKV